MSLNRKSNAKSLKEIIGDMSGASGVSSIIELNAIINAWNLIVGSYISRNTHIKSCIDGKLIITAESAPVRSEILLRKDKIIYTLNQELSTEKIKEISFI